ncbi:glycine oxidase ThiO [Ketobacter alkanivorans]|uniref:Glycine oxidase ThiO n=1 Tax=Ketobacter alkanivorans TaxID=1917421 RepID=A0A2K9LI47_9GAMM|nr:glycine oxidase ThiO [Ketobacter alkanivorans]AUM11952.1 glycine oxidase ThiO [Ketobacter alkanivorans]
MTDILIVGGGVIGLLLARELVKQSISVAIVDSGELGREASWAGGGIVSPLYPWNYSKPVTALANWAQQAYPNLAAELAVESGIDPEFNPCGLMMLDPPGKDRILDWASVNQKAVQLLSAQQALAKESALGCGLDYAVWWPHIGNIRNPRLLRSLYAYLKMSDHCKVYSHTEVESIRESKSGQVDIIAVGKKLTASKAVICAGAWTGKLLGALGVDTPIQPVRGQMLIFEPRPGLINSMILHQGRYLIPRLDGRILVGSTLEYTGFDKATTKEARELLLEQAFKLVPELRSVPVEAHWSGLRPGSPHGIPFIGKVPGWSNLYVNAGHFRNGLVLAPASVRLMRNLLLNEEPIVDPGPYDPLTPRPSSDMF